MFKRSFGPLYLYSPRTGGPRSSNGYGHGGLSIREACEAAGAKAGAPDTWIIGHQTVK